MKRAIPILDFVIGENWCNLRCQYCYSRDSLIKKTFPQVLRIGTIKNIQKIVKAFVERCDIGVLKFSGGEILLYENLPNLLEQFSDKCLKLQIQTNGLLLSESFLRRVQNIPNLGLQITLDGHTPEMNSYRMGKRDYIRLMENLKNAAAHNFPIDITTCIHNRNIEKLPEFAESVHSIPGRISMNFIPIRHCDYRFSPTPEQSIYIHHLAVLSQCSDILPPRTYLEELERFIAVGEKERFVCKLPIITIGINHEGTVKSCPLLETTEQYSLGNLLSEDGCAVISKIGTAPLHKALMHPNLHTLSCKKCFSYLEVLNDYINGSIDSDALKYCWIYDSSEMISLLDRCRNSCRPI